MYEVNDLQNMRQSYEQNQLEEKNIAKDPFTQFSFWFEQAVEAKVVEPNAMTIATADKTGMPSARIVLLKGFDENGFTFFTNYDSRKGKELEENPFASLLFWWKEFERQIRIEGKMLKISRHSSEEYFNSRPLESRYGAIASDQSEVISSRTDLEDKFNKLIKEFGDHPPMPENWGGYKLIPTKFEFWQGRQNRLHDRICYEKENDGWKIFRLQP